MSEASSEYDLIGYSNGRPVLCHRVTGGFVVEEVQEGKLRELPEGWKIELLLPGARRIPFIPLSIVDTLESP
jgi:hypothetical protein